MNNIVARFRDGRVLKGTSLAIDPSKLAFPLRPAGGKVVEVAFRELKAVFFVRSLEGNPRYLDAQTLTPGDPRTHGSTFVRLQFEDGEILTGLLNAYPPSRPFFYVNPADPASNNIRVLVNRAAVVEMEPVTQESAALLSR